MVATSEKHTVHVFVSRDRFVSRADVEAYVHSTYSPDGDSLPSAFVLEVDLVENEPMCVEILHAGGPVRLGQLVESLSYAAQWSDGLDPTLVADAVICVYSPNEVQNPAGASVTYLGAFSFAP